jgi:membrane-bound serine protease (ClpP class)
MDFISDPNIAYLFLVIGFLLAILAMLAPGTGLIELGALAMLLMAGWGIYNNPINWWALLILLVGVVPFILAVRKTRHWAFLLIAIIALVVGSVFLFREDGLQTAVNPILASVVSVLVGGFAWFATRRSLEALGKKPSHNLKDLVGMIGEAKTSIHAEGSVYVGGENWSARSQKPIPAKARVRVVKLEGFVLEVEALTEAKDK